MLSEACIVFLNISIVMLHHCIAGRVALRPGPAQSHQPAAAVNSCPGSPHRAPRQHWGSKTDQIASPRACCRVLPAAQRAGQVRCDGWVLCRWQGASCTHHTKYALRQILITIVSLLLVGAWACCCRQYHARSGIIFPQPCTAKLHTQGGTPGHSRVPGRPTCRKVPGEKLGLSPNNGSANQLLLQARCLNCSRILPGEAGRPVARAATEPPGATRV
jgi:hypothetical protein